MKILHTGDWHIGKVINDYSLLDDQRYIMDKLFKVIEEEQPDVLIITGDIYDRSIPPKEAVEFLNDTLTKLIEDYKLPTLIISGNHDSQERLNFGSKLLEHKQLYIQGLVSEKIKKVTLCDEYGNVNFYLLPYAHPLTVRHLLNDESISDHNKAFESMMNTIKPNLNLDERNVLITHNYVISNVHNALLSDSERCLSIGGTEYVDVRLVEDFDYVAIGHLHKMQKIKHNVMYSGSLLKYSFSEIECDKGVLLVDLKTKHNVNCEFKKLAPMRDMRVIKGELNDLVKPEFYQNTNCNDFILAILTDQSETYNPLETLRAVYPNILQIQRNNITTNVESVTKAKANFKNKDKLELFTEFYQNITENELDNAKKKILKEIIETVERDGCDFE